MLFLLLLYQKTMQMSTVLAHWGICLLQGCNAEPLPAICFALGIALQLT